MATKQNLSIDAGTDYTFTITVKHANNALFDFSDYTLRSKIKKHYFSANSITMTANGTSAGVLTLTLAATLTANVDPGRYVYDVEAVSSSNSVTRIVEGIATINPEVTT